MEISGLVSLFLGLTAGMMFGIVFSKYEVYSTIHDTKIAAGHRNSHVSLERDNLRGLLQANKKQNNSKTAVENNHAVALDYAVRGNSFYFKYDTPHPGDENTELAEIAAWQTFDPEYDAEKLKSIMSIFCIVVIPKGSVPQYGKVAYETWTKHCNDFIMVSGVDNTNYNVENINLLDEDWRLGGRAWKRTKLAFSHAVNAHPNHDWYIKVDHESFVVIENIRHMLLMHWAGIKGYAGHVIASDTPKKRNSVITLSKAAAREAVDAFPRCGEIYGGTEDFKELEACLRPLGIKASKDTLDSTGVNRFQMVRAKPDLPLNAHTSVDWSWRYIIDPNRMDQEGCCREYPVSFSFLSQNGFYLMEYMVYKMRPFGIGTYFCHPDQEKELLENSHVKLRGDEVVNSQ